MSIETKRYDDISKEEIGEDENHFQVLIIRCFGCEPNGEVEVAMAPLKDESARKVYELLGLDFEEAISDGEDEEE